MREKIRAIFLEKVIRVKRESGNYRREQLFEAGCEMAGRLRRPRRGQSAATVHEEMKAKGETLHTNTHTCDTHSELQRNGTFSAGH